MSASRKSKPQLEFENKMLRAANLSQSITTITTSFFKWAGLCTIFYFAFMSIDSLAGKNTDASIVIDLFKKVDIAIKLSWVVTFFSVFYAYKERQLRKTTIARLSSRNQDLEKEIDSGRTSSNLKSNGDTAPGD